MSGEGLSIDAYTRRIFYRTLALVMAVTSIFLLSGFKIWARGVILGGVASLAGLLIMARDVRRQVAVAAGKAARPGYGSYALRMTIVTAALVYAATSGRIALWTTIPAIFAAQIVMTLVEVLENREQEHS